MAGCMTWHYAVPSPPPPKSYRTGYRGYRPNETHGGDGTMVTTTTKTTVRTMRLTYICSQWRIQDFPEVGRQLPGGEGCQHMVLQNFPKNCMKLKEFGPLGDASPLSSATGSVITHFKMIACYWTSAKTLFSF